MIYDGSPEMRRELAKLANEGVPLTCPKCGAPLIIALDALAMEAHRVHPGVYCSRMPNHFFEIHELRGTNE